MERLLKAFWMIFALAILIGAVALVAWTVRAFFGYLAAVPKELGAALVAGTVTVLVATLTVMVGRYFERKRELDALYRDKKTEIYDAFLSRYFKLTMADSDAVAGTAEAVHKSEDAADPDLVKFLREFIRTLILWSGPNVISAFLAWKEHLGCNVPDAKTIFLTEDLLLAIRKDLRHSNRGLEKGFYAKLTLRESELFLSMAKMNPNVTLADLASAEAALSGQSDKTS